MNLPTTAAWSATVCKQVECASEEEGKTCGDLSQSVFLCNRDGSLMLTGCYLDACDRDGCDRGGDVCLMLTGYYLDACDRDRDGCLMLTGRLISLCTPSLAVHIV